MNSMSGERIRYFRNLCGMTMRHLGMRVGFPERSADIRISQYESGVRVPKSDMLEKLAGVLGVDPLALNMPDLAGTRGIMHFLFLLEDLGYISIENRNGQPAIVPEAKTANGIDLSDRLNDWMLAAERYRNGDMNQEEYNEWRLHIQQFRFERQEIELMHYELK